MPERFRRQKVRFHEQNEEVLRRPFDDEYSVMAHFSDHIDMCRLCIVPFQNDRNPMLCREGYLLSKDVCRYVGLRNGRVTSAISSRSPLEIAIPPRFAIIRRLLTARPRDLKSQGVNDGEMPKSRPESRHAPHQRSVEYVTIYLNLPALKIPLHIRRADLQNMYTT